MQQTLLPQEANALFTRASGHLEKYGSKDFAEPFPHTQAMPPLSPSASPTLTLGRGRYLPLENNLDLTMPGQPGAQRPRTIAYDCA